LLPYGWGSPLEAFDIENIESVEEVEKFTIDEVSRIIETFNGGSRVLSTKIFCKKG